jgi:hypothetical protein
MCRKEEAYPSGQTYQNQRVGSTYFTLKYESNLMTMIKFFHQILAQPERLQKTNTLAYLNATYVLYYRYQVSSELSKWNTLC